MHYFAFYLMEAPYPLAEARVIKKGMNIKNSDKFFYRKGVLLCESNIHAKSMLTINMAYPNFKAV